MISFENVVRRLRTCHKKQVQNAHLWVKWRIKLRVFRIIVLDIFQCDPGTLEHFTFDVLLRGRTADIVRRADSLENLNEPVRFLSIDSCDLGGTQETRMRIPQFPRKRNGKFNGEIGQEFIAAPVKRIEQQPVSVEVRRFRIGLLDGFKMDFSPGVLPDDPNLMDGNILGLGPAAMDRDGQPLPATWSLDLVAIAPAAFIVLDVIIKNKQIGTVDLIKISSPWDVGWLENDD